MNWRLDPNDPLNPHPLSSGGATTMVTSPDPTHGYYDALHRFLGKSRTRTIPRYPALSYFCKSLFRLLFPLALVLVVSGCNSTGNCLRLCDDYFWGREPTPDDIEVELAKVTGINVANKWGVTPLDYAISHENVAIVDMLIARGANVNARDYRQNSPLLRASWGGNVVIIKLLLDAGADVNAKNENNAVPLHEVVSKTDANIALIQILLDAGADVGVKDLVGHAPLHLAAMNDKKLIVIDWFLDAGADVNVKDNGKYTPLHYSARRGSTAIARRLLDAGADVHATTGWGSTPLHFAVGSGNAAIASLLLDAGADPFARDIADPFARDREGKRPFDYARGKPFWIQHLSTYKRLKAASGE